MYQSYTALAKCEKSLKTSTMALYVVLKARHDATLLFRLLCKIKITEHKKQVSQLAKNPEEEEI